VWIADIPNQSFQGAFNTGLNVFPHFIWNNHRPHLYIEYPNGGNMWRDRSNYSERDKRAGQKNPDRTPFHFEVRAGRVTFIITHAAPPAEATETNQEPAASPGPGTWTLTASPWRLNRILTSEDADGAQAEVIEIVKGYMQSMWSALAV
jgi:hypothetical protein